MDRHQLGEKLLQWHSSQWDPIYMVGSHYINGSVYPDKDIVESAVSNLTKESLDCQKMLDDIPVMVQRNGKTVELKRFAGYTDEELRERKAELEELTVELDTFLSEDYE